MDPTSNVANYLADDLQMVETNLGSQSSGAMNDLMVVDANHRQEYDDVSFRIESWFQLYNTRKWYKIDAVRIQYVWKDIQEHKLYFFLLDKHRHITPAIVSESDLPYYEGRELVGRLISLNFFQVLRKDPYDYPAFEKYSLEISNYVILLNTKTEVTDITNVDYDVFPKYPIMPSIKSLAEYETPRRLMTDVIGKVSKGYIMEHPQAYGSPACTLFLQDCSGSELKLVVLHKIGSHFSILAKAVEEQGILYVSRVKLINDATKNYLETTPLTVIELNPDTDETTYLGRLPIPITTQVDLLEYEPRMTGEFNPEMLGVQYLERLHI